jgi:hypothetical protein
MFCPQCGLQQVSEIVRFCPRCGFPLDGVIQLIENRGALPVYQGVEGPKEMSPRRKGVRQGGVLLLSGVLIVPLLGVLSSYFPNSQFLEFLLAIAAIICFVGGPLRMLYAGLFEEGAPTRPHLPTPMYAHTTLPQRPQMPSHRETALPPASVNPASAWRQRPNTAELAQPPSITENTTRLLEKLEKDEPKDR